MGQSKELITRNYGPRARVLYFLNKDQEIRNRFGEISRDDLENNLVYYYGTNSIVSIIQNKILKEVDPLLKSAFDIKEIVRILNIKNPRTGRWGVVALKNLIINEYSEYLPAGVNSHKARYIKIELIKEQINELVKGGFTTASLLYNKLPGFSSQNSLEKFLGDRMGGLKKVIDNNKIDLKVKILQIARDIIVQDPGISEKNLVRQLRDGKLIPRHWVIGDITDLFSLTHNELLLLCLTGSIPSNMDSIRLLVS